jgi:alpha-L-rhamnosidase
VTVPTSVHPFVQRASWIWSAEGTHAVPSATEASPSHYQVRRFRRRFILSAVGRCSATVHVSGDSRFLFYCNGHLLGRGPAKGDIHHQFYDTFDLTPYLRAGANVLAALVLDMSRVAHRPTQLGAPGSVMTYAGGFVLEGEVGGDQALTLDTGASGWLVATDRAYRFQNDGTAFEGYHGYFEHRVDRELPADWLSTDFDDSSWTPATTLYRAERYEDRRDPASPYGLIPRIIPPMLEKPPQRFAAAFAVGGGDLGSGWRDWPVIPSDVVVPRRSTVRAILDAGELTTAFPQLEARGGRGSKIRLIYAEALRLPWDTPGAELLGQKQSFANLASHFADESTGWTFDRRGAIRGWSDLWEPAGSGARETYEPLHWRAFRYVGLEIETADDPLVLLDANFRFTSYPLTIDARFSCSDARLERIWSVGLRTAQLCSHETFEDCPHYEQMQYAGDTMITSKIVMLTSGDYRLSRQALLHFDWSRLPDGLTQSRYPSRLLQVIPSWSLHWITAIRDYAYCSGDLATTGNLLPGVRAVLDWFRRHGEANGLPARLPYWNMTDWCPWWPRGVVPGAEAGPTCIIAAQYIVALDEAADLYRIAERTEEAGTLATEAATLRKRLHEVFWSESDGLYFDRPGGPELSQYANAWAVICGAAGGEVRRRMLERFPDDPQLAPGSFFCWHAVFRALAMLGAYGRMPEFLGPWHDSVNAGLTTFVEENSYWRSLCHAWSAHPILDFMTRILGVTPVSPGFDEVQVAPHPINLEHASGRVCTPHGPVSVRWWRDGAALDIEVNAPSGVPVRVIAPNGQVQRFGGGSWRGVLA